ncbi:hypothetical protein NKH93_33575 [Mesorhizobium sp. M0954]|uniref:hypothetical protein n=1 Tax=Mesorhizobium sp. M0954 TaxID=2957032 RepID=UPI00333AC680
MVVEVDAVCRFRHPAAVCAAFVVMPYFNSEILNRCEFNALQARERVFALHVAGLGRYSSGLFADILRQGDASGLEDGPDLAFHVGSGGDAPAILLHHGLLQPVQVAQQIAPFDAEAVGGAKIRQFLLQQQAQDEQNT